MRRLFRPLWILLALIFLIEAWLWDRVEPIVAWIVALIPLPRFKRWLAARVEHLSPPATLIVFAVPLILLFPLNLIEAWLIAHKYFVSAMLLIIFAKILGVGVIAFVFDVTRDKLLQMSWFRKLFEFVLELRARANAIVAPFKLTVGQWVKRLRGPSSSSFVQRLRRRIHASR